MEMIKKLVYGQREFKDSDLIRILDEVYERGDSLLIKSDGLRMALKYTFVVTSPHFTSIRFDTDSFAEGVIEILKRYLEAADRIQQN